MSSFEHSSNKENTKDNAFNAGRRPSHSEDNVREMIEAAKKLGPPASNTVRGLQGQGYSFQAVRSAGVEQDRDLHLQSSGSMPIQQPGPAVEQPAVERGVQSSSDVDEDMEQFRAPMTTPSVSGDARDLRAAMQIEMQVRAIRDVHQLYAHPESDAEAVGELLQQNTLMMKSIKSVEELINIQSANMAVLISGQKDLEVLRVEKEELKTKHAAIVQALLRSQTEQIEEQKERERKQCVLALEERKTINVFNVQQNVQQNVFNIQENVRFEQTVVVVNAGTLCEPKTVQSLPHSEELTRKAMELCQVMNAQGIQGARPRNARRMCALMRHLIEHDWEFFGEYLWFRSFKDRIGMLWGDDNTELSPNEFPKIMLLLLGERIGAFKLIPASNFGRQRGAVILFQKQGIVDAVRDFSLKHGDHVGLLENGVPVAAACAPGREAIVIDDDEDDLC